MTTHTELRHAAQALIDVYDSGLASYAVAFQRALGSLRAALAAFPKPPALTEEPNSSINITLRQAQELVAAFGGEDAEIVVRQRAAGEITMDDGEHSEAGLWAHFAECPEEGSLFLGATELSDEPIPATPTEPAKTAEGEIDDAQWLRGLASWAAVNASPAHKSGPARLRAIAERLAQSTTARRRDLYDEMADALGCDCMDSHDGRLQTAREARAALDKQRGA